MRIWDETVKSAENARNHKSDFLDHFFKTKSSIMTSIMSIKNINAAVASFLVANAKQGVSVETPGFVSDLENKEAFAKAYEEFVGVFGPVIQILGGDVDDEEGRANSDRAITALWNGDSKTQSKIRVVVRKKANGKTSVVVKKKKKIDFKVHFERKVVKKIAKAGKDMQKRLRAAERKELQKQKFLKSIRIAGTKFLKKSVKAEKDRINTEKKAAREAKKAARAAKKAAREAKKAAEKEMEDDLVSAMNGQLTIDEEQSTSSVSESDDSESEVASTKVNYSKMKIAELKSLCAERNIVVKGLKKAQIIEKLESDEDNMIIDEPVTKTVDDIVDEKFKQAENDGSMMVVDDSLEYSSSTLDQTDDSDIEEESSLEGDKVYDPFTGQYKQL